MHVLFYLEIISKLFTVPNTVQMLCKSLVACGKCMFFFLELSGFFPVFLICGWLNL